MTTRCPKCNTKNPDDSKFCKECAAPLQHPGDVSVTKTIKTPAQRITKGTLIAGKYQILQKLGEGGMGVVYKAKDSRLERTVALKFLSSDLMSDEGAKKRFIQEAKAAAALEHPNICTVYEVDEADGQTFIAMSHIDGRSLKDKLREGPLNVEEANGIAIQVAEGLKEAHEKGIVHRDIKPANIMITKKGQAKITDFGLAKLSWGMDLTKSSTRMGTVAYMSPEQARGEEVDHRTDIWSLGAMLYEMLTGERPFQRSREQALIFAILNDKPSPLSLLRSDIPAYSERVIEKALAKNTIERYQKIEDLISDLKESQPIIFPKGEKSIVVLPFDDLSPDRDQEYFSDGLTEEVISDLAGIGALRVISRSSAMTFKGTKKTAPDIAKRLNVQYVLEGSVRKAGNNLRITAQLIDATKDTHLWAEKYRGTLDDVFDIQEKVSHSIVQALKMKLSPEEKLKIDQHPIDNVQAYELHLRARYEMYQATENALKQALQFIKNGLEITGENEVLYADLGYIYLLLYEFISKEDNSYFNKANDCIEKVFALNPESAYGHFLKGNFKARQGKTQEAQKEFKKCLTIDPNHQDALFRLGWLYGHSGKAYAGRPLFDKLKEIDPLTPGWVLMSGAIEFFDGKYAAGLKAMRKAQTLMQEIPLYRFWNAKGFAYCGKYEEANKFLDLLEKENSLHVFGMLGTFFKYALKGEKLTAKKAVTDELKKMAREDEMFPIWMAESYALIDEHKDALDWLEHGVNFGFINYPFLTEYDPFLENIRGEPLFKNLMERVKHEWENFEV